MYGRGSCFVEGLSDKGGGPYISSFSSLCGHITSALLIVFLVQSHE